MATFKRKTLEGWIREAMAEGKDTGKENDCSQLVLVHMVGQLTKEIHTVRFGSGKTWSAKELAEFFVDKANTYAQDLSGTQMFQLLAFYGKNEPEGFHPFKVTPAFDPDTAGLMSEPPTAEGRLQQKMRWDNEVLAQAYRKQSALDDAALRFIALQSDLIAKLHIENTQNTQMVKELLVSAAMDQHKTTMEQLAYERASAQQKQLMGFVPALVNTVTGRNVFPQSSQDSALLDAIAEAVAPEHVMLLSQVLPPTLAGPLMARFESALKRKNDENEARSKALKPAGLNPEDDAAGDPNTK